MSQLTTVLILALASTDASQFYQVERQFQKEPNVMPYLAIALDEERLAPLLEDAGQWETPPEPRVTFFNDLNSLENFLQENPNDLRLKRTKTSLSIDNPLDVLRQQFFKALARRMKYKSIEKNREHLLKTGKRSGKEIPYPVNYSKSSDFPTENGSGETDGRSNEQKSTTRRYQNHFEDFSYQT